jgi:hypothetical protein
MKIIYKTRAAASRGRSGRARQPNATRHAAVHAGRAGDRNAFYSARAILHGRGGEVREMVIPLVGRRLLGEDAMRHSRSICCAT